MGILNVFNKLLGGRLASGEKAPRQAERNERRLDSLFAAIKRIPGEGEKLAAMLQERRARISFVAAGEDDDFIAELGGDAVLETSENGEKHLAHHPQSEHINLNLAADDQELVFGLLRECRQIMQHDDGFSFPPAMVSPFDMVWWEKAKEADATSYALVCLFKMKAAGFAKMFDLQKADESNAAACEAIERLYKKDSGQLERGGMRLAAFAGWFLCDEQKEHAEHHALHYREWLLEAFEKNGISTTETAITADMLKKIGVCGGGAFNYLDLPSALPLDHAFFRFTFVDKDLQKEWKIHEAERVAGGVVLRGQKRRPERRI